MKVKCAELVDNIIFLDNKLGDEFLDNEDTEQYIEPKDIWNNCKHLSPLDLYLILGLVNSNKYTIELILELLRPVWIEPIKRCWFRSQDWSQYSRMGLIGAHRISFEIFRGPLIGGLEICHHCDRRGCINPWHLFQGTHSDNIKDAKNKGRVFDIRI